MKKYEYKFVNVKMKLGFDFNKKIEETEQDWNKLGEQGWKFCTEGNGAIVFIREIEN